MSIDKSRNWGLAYGKGCNTLFAKSKHLAADPSSVAWETIRLFERNDLLQSNDDGCLLSGQIYFILTIPLLLGGLIPLPGAITDLIRSERQASAVVVVIVCALAFFCLYMLVTRGNEQRLYRKISLGRDALQDVVEFSAFSGFSMCEGPGFLLTQKTSSTITPAQLVGWNRRVTSYTWGAGARGGTQYLDVFLVYFTQDALEARNLWQEQHSNPQAQHRIARQLHLQKLRFAVHRWSTKGQYDRTGTRYSNSVPGGDVGDIIERYLEDFILLSSSSDNDFPPSTATVLASTTDKELNNVGAKHHFKQQA